MEICEKNGCSSNRQVGISPNHWVENCTLKNVKSLSVVCFQGFKLILVEFFVFTVSYAKSRATSGRGGFHVALSTAVQLMGRTWSITSIYSMLWD